MWSFSFRSRANSADFPQLCNPGEGELSGLSPPRRGRVEEEYGLGRPLSVQQLDELFVQLTFRETCSARARWQVELVVRTYEARRQRFRHILGVGDVREDVLCCVREEGADVNGGLARPRMLRRRGGARGQNVRGGRDLCSGLCRRWRCVHPPRMRWRL